MRILLFLSLILAIPNSWALRSKTWQKSDLKDWIATRSPESVSEVLQALPPELKRNRVALYHSRSLQAASVEDPRILLFNADASLVISFNGDPSQHGFESLEVMSFDHELFKFEFEEIVIPGDLAKRRELLEKENRQEELALLLNRATTSGVNAPACLGCHRSQPRPNWEPDSRWPGVFGQWYGPSFPSKPVTESVWQNDERYRELPDLAAQLNSPQRAALMNARFSRALARLNWMRLAKDIHCHPRNSELKNFASALGRMFSDSELRKLGLSREEYDLLITETRRAQWDSIHFNWQIQDRNENLEFLRSLVDSTELTTNYRILLEKILGLELSDYEMTFARGTYRFRHEGQGLESLPAVQAEISRSVRCDGSRTRNVEPTPN